MIKAVSIDEKGNVELTLSELNELIQSAYIEGITDGEMRGALKEKERNLNARLEEEEKKKSPTITTPYIPTPYVSWDTTPIPTTVPSTEKRITWDWNKITCDDSQTTVSAPKESDITLTNGYTPSEFNINNNSKKEKKNGRK